MSTRLQDQPYVWSWNAIKSNGLFVSACYSDTMNKRLCVDQRREGITYQDQGTCMI